MITRKLEGIFSCIFLEITPKFSQLSFDLSYLFVLQPSRATIYIWTYWKIEDSSLGIIAVETWSQTLSLVSK